MSRSAANITTKSLRRENTLMDSFSAVQQIISEMPEAAFSAPSDMADAFLRTDPVLSTLQKQKNEADTHYKKAVRANGFDDAMVEAVIFQRAAIEDAYSTRLAALRRHRSEQTGRSAKQASNDDQLRQEQNTRKATQDRLRIQREEDERLMRINDEQRMKKKRNDTLWSWAFLMLILNPRVAYQQRPALRPI